ncbi:MAG: GNAT family N-acetyltransferase, partial [Chryseobacterium sp.]
QLYLLQFYSNLGFKQVSEIYLEDDIPHITMLHTKNN